MSELFEELVDKVRDLIDQATLDAGLDERAGVSLAVEVLDDVQEGYIMREQELSEGDE